MITPKWLDSTTSWAGITPKDEAKMMANTFENVPPRSRPCGARVALGMTRPMDGVISLTWR